MEDVLESDWDARGFSVRTGYYLAYASMSAYEEGSAWIEKLGPGIKITPFTCDQFHGFVGFRQKTALLAFRGTQNVGNCLTDAEAMLVSHPSYPGRVHCGFAEAVDRVWPEVERLLGTASRTMPLWVTGHSLGGAMATLASVRLASEGYAVRAVYTYGSPCVGDGRFHDSYRLANYRFVNDNDLVPHLPFLWCYKHVGELKLVDDQGNLAEDKAAWHAKRRGLAGQAKRIQRAHRGPAPAPHLLDDFDWLADHHLDRYLAAIRRILPRPLRRRRLDPASPATAPPPLRPRSRPKPAISEAAFIAAFFAQPPSRVGCVKRTTTRPARR